MTQQLRDELSRIADQAPAVHVPADAWSRGRRARRTDRVLAVATALALVVLLGGVTVFLVDGRTRIAPAGEPDGPGAVPATLYPVPTHVQTDDASYTSDLGVGQSSVAFVTSGGVPVVVSASDGSYRLLDLPGWPWRDSDLRTRYLDPGSAQPLALSPDGTTLVWGYSDNSGSGVRTADLETGAIEEHPLRPAAFPGPEFAITSVTWSGDSDRFAWSAQTTSEPFATWYGYLGEAGYTVPWGASEDAVTIGIGEWGESVVYTDDFARIPSQEGVGYDNSFTTDDLDESTPVASFSPDGSQILFGSTVLRDDVDVVSVPDQRIVRRALSPDVHPEGAYVAPLGWVDDDTAVVLARTDQEPPHVALMSVPDDERTYEIVTRTVPTDDSGGVASYHSVAVDLLDRPTADLPAPEWPWSPERERGVLGLTVLAGLLALGGAVARRYRLL